MIIFAPVRGQNRRLFWPLYGSKTMINFAPIRGENDNFFIPVQSFTGQLAWIGRVGADSSQLRRTLVDSCLCLCAKISSSCIIRPSSKIPFILICKGQAENNISFFETTLLKEVLMTFACERRVDFSLGRKFNWTLNVKSLIFWHDFILKNTPLQTKYCTCILKFTGVVQLHQNATI